jgi:hypothetical protein
MWPFLAYVAHSRWRAWSCTPTREWGSGACRELAVRGVVGMANGARRALLERPSVLGTGVVRKARRPKRHRMPSHAARHSARHLPLKIPATQDAAQCTGLYPTVGDRTLASTDNPTVQTSTNATAPECHAVACERRCTIDGARRAGLPSPRTTVQRGADGAGNHDSDS